jgi:hypothetical protein
MAVNGPTELSSRPERSAVEGPAVSLPVLTQILKPDLPESGFFRSLFGRAIEAQQSLGFILRAVILHQAI